MFWQNAELCKLFTVHLLFSNALSSLDAELINLELIRNR